VKTRLLWSAGILLAVLVALALIPAVRDECHWQWASLRDRARDYEAYVRARPSGRHITEAGSRCDERSWTDATAANTMEGFEQYLESHQSGTHAAEASRRLAELKWELASAADTEEAYRRFLESNLQSEFADEAIKRLIAKSPQDPVGRARFAKAQALGMHFAYKKFAATHASSPFAFKAKRKLLGFGKLTVEKSTLIPTADLTGKYGWNGEELLWKWGEDAAGLQTSGGTFFLSRNTVDPKFGIRFEMGFGGSGFGSLCIGNLQFRGRCVFEEDGLRLAPKSLLIYPR